MANTPFLPYEILWQGEWLPVCSIATWDQLEVEYVNDLDDVIYVVAYDQRNDDKPWCVLTTDDAPLALKTVRRVGLS